MYTTSVKFEHPATVTLTGPSSSGKTTLALGFIRNQEEWFSHPFQHYFWCLPEGSRPPEMIEKGQPYRFHIIHGIPDGSTLPPHSLVVLDDLMHQQDQNAVLLHTVYSHHSNLTIISLTHSLFPKNRFHRDMTLSTKYIIVKKSPRDYQSFHRLAIQLNPEAARSLYEAYLDAVSIPYNFILIDLTQSIHPALRFRSVLPLGEDSAGQAHCVYAQPSDIDRLIRDFPLQYERFCEAEPIPDSPTGQL